MSCHMEHDDPPVLPGLWCNIQLSIKRIWLEMSQVPWMSQQQHGTSCKFSKKNVGHLFALLASSGLNIPQSNWCRTSLLLPLRLVCLWWKYFSLSCWEGSVIKVNIFLTVHFQGFWLDERQKKHLRFSNGKICFHNLNCCKLPGILGSKVKDILNSALPKYPKG